jgi:MFS family permease
VILLISLAMFGIFFFNSLFFQQILRYSPIETGALFLPMTVLIIVGAPLSGRLADRIGSRWLIATGMLLIACSLVLFGQLDLSSNFWNVLPGLLTGGLGMAMAITPCTAAAMGSVPTDKAGVGSAVLNAFRQVGGSLGIAVMGALVASRIHVGPSGASYPLQFIAGYHLGLHVGAAIALVGACLAVLLVRKYEHVDEPVGELA